MSDDVVVNLVENSAEAVANEKLETLLIKRHRSQTKNMRLGLDEMKPFAATRVCIQIVYTCTKLKNSCFSVNFFLSFEHADARTRITQKQNSCACVEMSWSCDEQHSYSYLQLINL